jgi:hypothetical protein
MYYRCTIDVHMIKIDLVHFPPCFLLLDFLGVSFYHVVSEHVYDLMALIIHDLKCHG